MADSKITQLSLSPYALDKDLVVVVTGHLEEGAFPRNVKMPLSYIRRYVVRLNLLTSPQSGISTYYNSGLNILTLQHTPITGNLMRYDYAEDLPHDQTISTTGLNAIVGNNIDISFAGNGNASIAMRTRDGSWQTDHSHTHMGDPYHSGIISTTGLNATDANLMRIDYEGDWPHTGLISQTGLNIIRGNLIDIQFQRTSDAASAMHSRLGSWPLDFNRNEHLGEPYHSGIVSVTGLNAYSGGPWGNLMRVDIDESRWPHSGIISQTGLNAIKGNLVDIQFSSTSEAATAMHNRDAGWLRTFNTGDHLGNQYHSGIISITGVNARTENLLVKEYEDTWPYTGVYYNTGLNARAGNHIEIMHSTNSDADFFYPGIMGEKYQSGVISVTGLNVSQATGNLIVNHIDRNWPHRNILHTTGLNAYSGAPWGNNVRIDYGSQWPYSGIISQTGLNVIRGNLIDIQFDSTSDAATTMHSTNGPWNNAFNKSSHLGNKYHSGIISVTGLNVDGAGGNRITYNINNDWPHKYSIDATGLNVVAGNTFSNALNGIAYNIEPDDHHRYDLFSLSKIKHYSSSQTIVKSGDSNGSVSNLDAGAFISYCNIKRHKPSDNLTVLAEAQIKLPNDLFRVHVPEVADLNLDNDQKTDELGSVTGTEVTIAGLTDTDNTDTQLWDPWSLIIDPSAYADDTHRLKLTISISGYNPTTMKNSIFYTHHGIATVANGGGIVANGRSPSYFHLILDTTTPDVYRINFDGNMEGTYNIQHATAQPFSAHTINIKTIVSPQINSSTYNTAGCVGIKYTLQNPKYTRTFRKLLGTATADADGFNVGDDVYRYHTSTKRTAFATCTFDEIRYLKCEPMEQAPTITFMSQPVDILSSDGTATLTSQAKVNDYTDPLYQWEKAESGTVTFAPVAGQNSETLNLTGLNFENDNGDKYRLRVIAYDGLTVSTSNTSTLTVQPPLIAITSDPDPQPIAHDGTASFSASASANIPGSPINYQWQVSTDGGSSYANITDATSTTLNLTELTSSDDGNLYRMKANASGFNEVISASAELYYIEIAISSHPSDLTVPRGTGLLSVSATQTADSPFNLYYRWERSTNAGGSYSYYNAGTGLANLIFTDSSNITYANHDQDQFRVKVRLQGFGDDVETTGNIALLTVQEINILTEPDETNTISGKDLFAPTATQTLIPTTGGNLDLFVAATGRNNIAASLNYQWQTGNIPTHYWQSPTVWGDITGETNKRLEIRGLVQNSTYQFYRCVIDDDLNGLDDTTGMESKISNTCKVTTSTFVGDSSVSIDDNATFASVERDGTSSLAETDFLTFCYGLDQGVGYTVSVDPQPNKQAGINFGTGLAPLGPTGIARLLATHPNSASDSASLTAGSQFSAGDVINIQVTGNVNQFLGRINVPIPTTVVITAQPQDLTVPHTLSTFSFDVTALRTGPGNLKYAWEKASYDLSTNSYGPWINVRSSSSTSQYTDTISSTLHKHQYRANITVTNTDISLFSNSGELKLSEAIVIQKQPDANIVYTGIDVFTYNSSYGKPDGSYKEGTVSNSHKEAMIPIGSSNSITIEATGIGMIQGDLNFQWQTGIYVGGSQGLGMSYIQWSNYGSSTSSSSTVVHPMSLAALNGTRQRYYARCIIDDGGSNTETSNAVLLSDTPWITHYNQVSGDEFALTYLHHEAVYDRGGYYEIMVSGGSNVTRANYSAIQFCEPMPASSGIGYETVIKRDSNSAVDTIGLRIEEKDHSGPPYNTTRNQFASNQNEVNSISSDINTGNSFLHNGRIEIGLGDATDGVSVDSNTSDTRIQGHLVRILVPKY